MNERKLLTGNQLKILAVVTMAIDHIGAYLFPQIEILRIIGRIAFPIFAYMIAEGCTYTRNRKKYLITLTALALAFQVVLFLAKGSLSQCVFVTFSLSVVLCFLYDKGVRQNQRIWLFVGILTIVAVYWTCQILPKVLSETDFSVDYGFWGVMLPVAVFVAEKNWHKLIAAGVVMLLIALDYGYLQWFSLAALPLLALYNGKRGRHKMKYFFYIFYPAHLVVIYLAGMVMK